MPALPFDQLNEAQAAQAAWMFADEAFGTDPRAYLYEVDRDGDVTARAAAQAQPKTRAAHKANIRITAQAETRITQEMTDRANAATESLAAAVAESIYQHQMENQHATQTTA